MPAEANTENKPQLFLIPIMQDKFERYIRLGLNLFLTLLVFLLALALVMLALKYTFRFLDYIPWFVYLYVLFILSVPGVLFLSVFAVFARRTNNHPAKAVRIISYVLFAGALLCWSIAYIYDMIYFIKTGSREIKNYYSYNMYLLAGSVALTFLIGVLQALSTEKEKDWMEKHREREQLNIME